MAISPFEKERQVEQFTHGDSEIEGDFCIPTMLGPMACSLGPAPVANSLCRGQEKRTMRETEVPLGNSGLLASKKTLMAQEKCDEGPDQRIPR